MKREILFRGKSINSNEWIESMTVAKGTIKRKRDCVYLSIGDNVWRGVKPETVGQFTGLLDKNKVRIFEDDICKSKTCAGKYQIKQVKYHHYGFFIGDYPISENVEVIGNIHDNPSLL